MKWAPRRPARYGQNDCEIALNRKNALFAGSDSGGENWAIIASLSTHPAKTAGAAQVAQAAAWSAKDVDFKFHGSSSVILLAG